MGGKAARLNVLVSEDGTARYVWRDASYAWLSDDNGHNRRVVVTGTRLNGGTSAFRGTVIYPADRVLALELPAATEGTDLAPEQLHGVIRSADGTIEYDWEQVGANVVVTDDEGRKFDGASLDEAYALAEAAQAPLRPAVPEAQYRT